MKYLEDLLKPDSELQLVGNWAQRPSDSTTIRLPALHSLVCVDRMNVQIALKRRLLANMREWPLHHFFKVASHWADGYCNDANERQNATFDPSDEVDRLSAERSGSAVASHAIQPGAI